MSQFQTLDATALFRLSKEDQLNNDVTTPYRKWFSLGQNMLDGTFIPMPEDIPDDWERGWWSEQYSGEDGRFAISPTITGTVIPQPAFILRIVGDMLTGNHPVDMDITFWDTNEEIIRVDQVRGNEDVDYNHIINVPELYKVEIKFLTNSLPNAELRIVEVRILLEDEYIHELMDDPNRRVYCKVNISYLDPFKTYTVTPSAESTFRLADINQITDGIEETTEKWFSLTNNMLDGSYRAMCNCMDPNMQIGWWSNAWSNDDGVFEEPPIIVMQLTPQPVVGFTMIGDRKTNCYPVDFNIELYEGDALIHTEEVRGNTAVNYARRFIFPNISKYIIRFLKVSIPGDQLRLVEVSSKFSETYMSDQLINVNLLEEIGFPSNGLPIGNISSNEININISDPQNEFDLSRATARYKGLLLRNRSIKADLGVELYPGYIKWYPFGTYYSTKWNVRNGEIMVSLTGRDVLELLRQDNFLDTSVYTNISMYDLFDLVLDSFPLLDLNYVIDESLKDYIVPYAWFGPDTYRTCLAKLCEASLTDVFVTRDNVIQVTRPKVMRDIDYTFTDEYSIYDRNYPSAYNANINSIRLEGQTFKESDVYKLLNTATTNSIKANTRETYTIISTQQPIIWLDMTQLTLPAGIVVHQAKQTSWGILLDIENPTSEAIEFEVKNIDGKTLEVDQKFERIAKDSTDIQLNGLQEQKHTSIYLQDSNYTQQFADDLLTEIRKSPMNVEISTRGHVYINLLDTIRIMNQDNSEAPRYHMTEIKSYWDGGLEASIRAKFM